MSETENGQRKTERLDVAIDRAVREMLDVEPPAGLRGRVLDRISNAPVGSAFRPKAWILAPIAAAAVILLAVLLPSRTPAGNANPPSPAAAPAPQVVTTTPTPATTSAAPVAPTSPSHGSVPAAASARGSRTLGEIHAAVAGVDAAADPTAIDATQVAALDGPPPLSIQELTGPPSAPMRSIAVAPIQVAALEVNALSVLPRERQHEE